MLEGSRNIQGFALIRVVLFRILSSFFKVRSSVNMRLIFAYRKTVSLRIKVQISKVRKIVLIWSKGTNIWLKKGNDEFSINQKYAVQKKLALKSIFVMSELQKRQIQRELWRELWFTACYYAKLGSSTTRQIHSVCCGYWYSLTVFWLLEKIKFAERKRTGSKFWFS